MNKEKLFAIILAVLIFIGAFIISISIHTPREGLNKNQVPESCNNQVPEKVGLYYNLDDPSTIYVRDGESFIPIQKGEGGGEDGNLKE